MNSLSFIDTSLLRKLEAHPEKAVSVLISYDEPLLSFRKAIEQSNIKITDEMPELEIIQASIICEDLKALENIRGVTWIETNEKVEAL